MKKNIPKVLVVILNTLNFYTVYSQEPKVYNNVETENVLYYKVEEIVKMTFGGTTTRYNVSNLNLISKAKLGPDNIRIITPVYKDRNNRKKYYVETKNLDKGSGRKTELNLVTEITIEDKKIETSGDPKVDKISLALAISNLIKAESIPAVNAKPAKTNKLINVGNASESLKAGEGLVSLVLPSLIKIEPNPFVKSSAQKKQEITNVSVASEKSNKVKNSSILLTANVAKTESISDVKNEPLKAKQEYVSINVTDVYERVAQKGYKSVYMFKEMANSYYFKNQMEKAAKWYTELFAMTKDLEPMYYYRFGLALIKSGNVEKGNAMLEKFNQLVN